MKSLKFVMSVLVLALLGFSANAQSCHGAKGEKGAACCAKPGTTATGTASATATLVADVSDQSETFKVYGNCGMCKKTIEGSLKNVEGVSVADWDQTTKIMTVAFNPKAISLDDIKQKIADVGYDSDSHRAKDEVYSGLHGCCQYERPTN